MRLTQSPVSMDAISRTDRGVHAKGQIVQFFASCKIPASRLPTALNAHLPKDIRIQSVQLSPNLFTPLSKTYCYSIDLGPFQSPFLRDQTWHYPYPIDLDLLKQGASFLIGTHNFSSFSTDPTADPTRTLHAITVANSFPLLQIRMTGDKFLYKMARTIAGTLLNLGSGKLSKEIFYRLLEGNNRVQAGVTAPPEGLCLEKIDGV